MTLPLLAAVGLLAFPYPGPLRAAEVDLHAELATLWRVAACGPPIGGGVELAPAQRALVGPHCEALGALITAWRDGWYAAARPFFADLVPADVPRRVVYPFGGADLLSALTVFPEADEITLLALEPGGDPRSLADLRPGALRRNLHLVRQHFKFLAHIGFSRTVDLDELSKGMLAGVLIYDLAALAALGYEPVRLRLFTLASSGGRLYRSDADLAAVDLALARLRSPRARAAAVRDAFGAFELLYRRRPSPSDPSPRVRTFRHIACDLSDGGLRARPEVLRYLEGRGPVAVVTKASSYLLWHRGFSLLRGYLGDHLQWMVSDTSGLAPDTVDPATFEQLTWGSFKGPIISCPKDRAAMMEALFAEHPERALPIAFGYPDKQGRYGLLVTRRRPLGP